MSKSGITIRMGASRFDVVVRTPETIRVFDIRRMSRKDEHAFRKMLVFKFRESRE